LKRLHSLEVDWNVLLFHHQLNFSGMSASANVSTFNRWHLIPIRDCVTSVEIYSLDLEFRQFFLQNNAWFSNETCHNIGEWYLQMIICEHFHCSHRDFRTPISEIVIQILWRGIIRLKHSLTHKSISYQMICPCEPQHCKSSSFRSPFSPFLFHTYWIKRLFFSFADESHECDARNEQS
jgi:hypothetical protein